MRITHIIHKFIRDEEGVTAVEYGLIAALIAAILIPAVTLLGVNLRSKFNFIASAVGS